MKKSSHLMRLTAIVMLAVMMLGMGANALAASFSARINSNSAKVYRTPSTSSASVSGGKGITVKVTGLSGSWARISYKGNTGYIKYKYLNMTDRAKAYTAKSTAVYKEASSSSGKMGTLPIGTGVYVVGKDGGYYRIQNASGSVTGYVSSGNLTTYAKLKKAYDAYKAAQEAENNAANDNIITGGSNSSTGSGTADDSFSDTGSVSKIDRVISLAKSLVGRPYAISDNPPASFNCSSFVQYCMGKYGYSFASSAASQAAMSNKVSASRIQKGDVLCFDTDDDGTCDHTAIYLGGSKFIEASQNAGKVQINTLDDWYENRLMHAIRPK